MTEIERGYRTYDWNHQLSVSKLQATNPSLETWRRAGIVVASKAEDRADALDLLNMLGISERLGRG